MQYIIMLAIVLGLAVADFATGLIKAMSQALSTARRCAGAG